MRKRISAVVLGCLTICSALSLSAITTQAATSPQVSPALSAKYVSCQKTPSGTQNLTVASVAVVSDFAPLYIAKGQGLFAKCGVNVTIMDNTLGNTLADLTSGAANIAVYSATVALQAELQGAEPMSIVYMQEVLPGDALVSEPSVTSIAQLKSIAHCRIGFPQSATSTYGAGVSILKLAGITNCSPITITSPALLIAAVSSGQVNAAIMIQANAALSVTQGDHELVNPTLKATRKAYFPPSGEAISASYFGISSVLQSHSQAVVRFLRALNLACTRIDNENNTQVAEDLYNADPIFRLTGLAAIANTFATSVRPYTCGALATSQDPRVGFIDKTRWNKSLNSFTTWGLTPYSRTSPLISYSNIVNMSYYNQAFPLAK